MTQNSIHSKDHSLLIACNHLENLGLFGDSVRSYVEKSTEGIFIATYQKGETVFSRKTYQKALGVIIEGELSSHKRIAGGDLALRMLTVGEIFGVAGLFTTADQYVSEVVANTDAKIVFFSEAFLYRLFEEIPACAIAYIQLLSKKIRYLNAKLDGFASPNAYSKLALFLYENKGYSGSMTSLAELLGMSRMTLYRNLELLEEEGTIKKEGKVITVVNNDLTNLLHSQDEII